MQFVPIPHEDWRCERCGEGWKLFQRYDGLRMLACPKWELSDILLFLNEPNIPPDDAFLTTSAANRAWNPTD
ncbi:MAG: hypothetical protein WAJ92_06030 [Candidatus Acidiferrales bacterium]